VLKQYRVSMDTKDMEIKAKGGEEGAGTFKGYASTFGNWDDVFPVPERPVKGAFQKYLGKFIDTGFIAGHHKWQDNPVAMVKAAEEDDYGLKLTADFHSTQAAQDIRTIMAERLDAGKSVGLSIGYIVHADEYVEEGRLLKEIELFETSFVNVPANPKANATVVKDRDALAGLPFDTHIETVLVAVQGVVERASQIKDLRKEKGRTLGTTAQDRLNVLLRELDACKSNLDDMLKVGDESEAMDIASQLIEARKRFALLELELNEVM
jgi:HK97 family phage prohead protease